MTGLAIPKTYKLFIGGKFPRSESGRTFETRDADGRFLANVAKASRKDARDAVVAARAAQAGWAAASGYNRGQVLYRVAEMLEGRRPQFEDFMVAEGETSTTAAELWDTALRQLLWYAGWADKYLQVAGNANPVSGPYFNLSTPEPTGVVAIVAPPTGIAGLLAVIAPALVSGNSVVVIASEKAPLSSITLAEVLATSDVPAGVVNILTGSAAEIAPWLASHSDVNALDLSGAEELDWVDLQVSAAETLKRVIPPGDTVPSLDRILAFTETKTVWHTKSLL